MGWDAPDTALDLANTSVRAIAVEIWAVPPAGICQILLGKPPGLCIGKVRLNNGEVVLGVLGEASLCKDQPEITQWGSGRAYTSCSPKLMETKKKSGGTSSHPIL
jgi:hypothetical protein